MFDVLKVFYTYHYNLGALAVLILLLLIYLLTKKNFRLSIVVCAVLIAMNVFIYKRTDGNSWTIFIDQPAEEGGDGYENQREPEPIKMTFSVNKNWTITDKKGDVHHWCWVEVYWDKFASTDLVAAAWGSNASKKMTKSTESRTNLE